MVVGNQLRITGSASLPVSGRLVYDALFKLQVNDENPVVVFIAASTTSNNTNRNDLIGDIQSALNAAGMASVTASLSPLGQLQLTTSATVLAVERATFGVFSDAGGNWKSHNGDLNGDGKLDADPTQPAWQFEDTGLNRVLGGSKPDLLYGGTGLDFLYGNGAPEGAKDVIFDRNGEKFEIRMVD